MVTERFDKIIIQDLLSGPTSRRGAELILGTRPFFIKYLNVKFENESSLNPESSRIAQEISEAINVFEGFAGVDDSGSAMEDRRKQYKKLLLESVADTMTFPVIAHPKALSCRRKAAHKAKLYGGLILASLLGDTETMSKILDAGAKVNMYHPYFGSPLAASARTGQPAAADLLLQLGASILSPRYDPMLTPVAGFLMSRLPFVAACFNGNEEIVRLMLKFGDKLHNLAVEINRMGGSCRRIYFRAALAAAFRGRHLNTVNVLMEDGVLPLPDAQAQVFYTAAEHGSVEMINALVAAGFNPKDERYFESTRQFPLEAAARMNKVPALKTLLELGLAKGQFHNGPQKYGRALHEAASRGSIEAAKVLIADHSSVLKLVKYEPYRGHILKTPIQLALWHDQEDTLEYFLSITGKPGLHELGPRVLSGLATEGKIEMIQILLEAGADPNYYPPRFPQSVQMPPLLVATARSKLFSPPSMCHARLPIGLFLKHPY